MENEYVEIYYTTNEVVKKLVLNEQITGRMCQNGRLKGAICSDGGHWRIPESCFITTKEQDKKAEKLLSQIDQKNL